MEQHYHIFWQNISDTALTHTLQIDLKEHCGTFCKDISETALQHISNILKAALQHHQPGLPLVLHSWLILVSQVVVYSIY